MRAFLASYPCPNNMKAWHLPCLCSWCLYCVVNPLFGYYEWVLAVTYLHFSHSRTDNNGYNPSIHSTASNTKLSSLASSFPKLLLITPVADFGLGRSRHD